MTTFDNEIAKIKAIEAKSDAKWADASVKFDAIKAEVAALKAQIDAGNQVDTTALDAALQELDDHITAAVVPSE